MTGFEHCRRSVPVQARHHHHVARRELVEQTAKLGAVSFGSARHLPKHRVGICGLQSVHLRRHCLPVRRDSRVAINHPRIMAVIYAKENHS